MNEIKLELKKPLLSYNKKPIKDNAYLTEILAKNNTLTQEQALNKCPDLTFGAMLPLLLIGLDAPDPKEKLKIFRWASKIEDKMITNKGEITLDLNNVTELYDLICKVQGSTIVIAPILIEFERLKEELSKE